MEDIQKILSESGKPLTLEELMGKNNVIKIKKIKKTKLLAKNVSKEELKTKIKKELEKSDKNGVDFMYILEEKLLDETGLIAEFENLTFNGRDYIPVYEEDNVFDIHTTKSDLTYCLCSDGGDCSIPVSFILYIDDKDDLQIYMPLQGNVFNEVEFCCYGLEDDFENKVEHPELLELDMKKFEKDIEKNIKVV